MTEVVKSHTTGRYLAACRTHGYGDIIRTIKPDVIAFGSKEIASSLCSSCCLASMSMQACTGCKQVYYCGKNCQKLHWKNTHKLECKYLNSMRPHTPVGALMAVMRALLLSRHDQDKATSFEQMESHSIAQRERKSIPDLDILIRGLSVKLEEPNLTLIEGAYHRLMINSMELVSDALEPLGVILDPTIALLNHSCSPNAYITFDGNLAVLRAFTLIRPGDQVSISYIDVRTRYKSRQAELKSRYYFECKCDRCLRYPENLTEWEKEIEGYRCCGARVLPGKEGDYLCSVCLKVLPLAEIEDSESRNKESLGPSADMSRVTASIQTLTEKGWWSPFSQPLFALHVHATGLCIEKNDMHRALIHALRVIKLPITEGPIMSNDLLHLVKTMQVAIAASVDQTSNTAPFLDKMELAALALYLSKAIDRAVVYTHAQSRFSQIVHQKVEEFRHDLTLDARGAALLSMAQGPVGPYYAAMQPIFQRVAHLQSNLLNVSW